MGDVLVTSPLTYLCLLCICLKWRTETDCAIWFVDVYNVGFILTITYNVFGLLMYILSWFLKWRTESDCAI